MDSKKIGKFIYENRLKQNLTQKELARNINVTDKAISKWETGKGIPDISLLKILSSTLNVTISELINGEKDVNNTNINKDDIDIENTIKLGQGAIKKKVIRSSVMLSSFYFAISGYLNNSYLIFYFGILVLIILMYKSLLRNRLIKIIVFLILVIISIFVGDYYKALNNYEPFLKLMVENNDTYKVYNNFFYKINNCNYDTNNQYFEINQNKNVCNNFFDPNRHDIERLFKYQNKYLGNNSNTINLVNNLLMAQYGFTIRIDSDKLILNIYYNNSEFYINEDNKSEIYVENSIFYNSANLFYLIKNLKEINYHFSGSNHMVVRSDFLNNNKLFSEITTHQEFRDFISRGLKRG